MVENSAMVEHIRARNASGRLALVVYLIHGYPSLEVSAAAFELLKSYHVIFECGLPVASLSGSSGSPAIIRAHQRAAQAGLSDEAFISFYANYRPNILAHIEDGQRRNAKELYEQIQGSFDSVMTDHTQLEAVIRANVAINEPAPLLIQSVSARSETLADLSVQHSAVIHLGLARQAGAELLPLTQLQTAVDKVAEMAPRAKILSGFGLRSAADVRHIRRLRGVHGVTIGSAAMNRLSEGMPKFESWLAAINRELSYD